MGQECHGKEADAVNAPEPTDLLLPPDEAQTEPADAAGPAEDSAPELLPAPAAADDAPQDPGPADAAPRRREALIDAFAWIRAALPVLLAGFAAAVFTGTAILLLLRLSPTPDRVTRALLSTALGGREVRLAEKAGTPQTAALPRLIPDRPTAPTIPADPPETAPQQPQPPDTPAEEEPAETAPPPEIPAEDAPRFTLTNETAYSPDPDALLARDRAIPPLGDLRAAFGFGPDAPLVLILHTHTTEGYLASAGTDYRTDDPAENVVAVGTVLAECLNEAGIPAIHLTEVFDEPDFNLAYYHAARAIRNTLAEHPSIRYIFDLHRDSIALPDGSVCAALAQIGGEPAGRLMFVVGTDAAGADHPGWEDNLALALRLQRAAEAAYPGLMRDINLRAASFNEQYAPGALLIEAGSTGCTLDEARRGMACLAEVIAAEIAGGSGSDRTPE